jgi:hypothetical protein
MDLPWNKPKNAVRPRKAHDGLRQRRSVSIDVHMPSITDTGVLDPRLARTKQMYSEKSNPAI